MVEVVALCYTGALRCPDFGHVLAGMSGGTRPAAATGHRQEALFKAKRGLRSAVFDVFYSGRLAQEYWALVDRRQDNSRHQAMDEV
jgi:hypothetical protein